MVHAMTRRNVSTMRRYAWSLFTVGLGAPLAGGGASVWLAAHADGLEAFGYVSLAVANGLAVGLNIATLRSARRRLRSFRRLP